VLLWGIALFVAASIACALATTIDQLILARLVQAMGACCGPVLARAVVRDVYGRERAARMYAYMAMAMALAPALAPMLGGILVEGPGWRATFGVLGLFGVVILGATWLMLAETNPHLNPEAMRPARLIGNYVLMLGERRFGGYSLCFAGVFCSIFAFVSGSPFVLIGGDGLSPFGFGLCFSGVAVGYMTGNFLSGFLTVALGIDRMVVLGLAAANGAGLLGVGLAVAGVTSVVAVVGPMALVMVGAGLVLPNAMAGAIAPFGSMAGAASAMLGFLQMLSAAGVGIVVGRFADHGALPMMATILLANLLAALAYFGLARAGMLSR
jgi:DHA1 family bicyclomycin/chloramphenicol resistance-like MFS transporter